MNGLPICKQNHPEKFVLLFNLFPLADSSVRLNLGIIRILGSILNPFRSYFSTVGSSPDMQKILGKFHFGLFLSLTTQASAARGCLRVGWVPWLGA